MFEGQKFSQNRGERTPPAPIAATVMKPPFPSKGFRITYRGESPLCGLSLCIGLHEAFVCSQIATILSYTILSRCG